MEAGTDTNLVVMPGFEPFDAAGLTPPKTPANKTASPKKTPAPKKTAARTPSKKGASPRQPAASSDGNTKKKTTPKKAGSKRGVLEDPALEPGVEAAERPGVGPAGVRADGDLQRGSVISFGS